jgi:outer membrane protein TolC
LAETRHVPSTGLTLRNPRWGTDATRPWWTRERTNAAFPYPLWAVRIRRSDFLPSFEASLRRTRSRTERSLLTAGSFQLWLQFGRRTMSTSALKSANTVIEQLRVAQRR